MQESYFEVFVLSLKHFLTESRCLSNLLLAPRIRSLKLTGCMWSLPAEPGCVPCLPSPNCCFGGAERSQLLLRLAGAAVKAQQSWKSSLQLHSWEWRWLILSWTAKSPGSAVEVVCNSRNSFVNKFPLACPDTNSVGFSCEVAAAHTREEQLRVPGILAGSQFWEKHPGSFHGTDGATHSSLSLWFPSGV